MSNASVSLKGVGRGSLRPTARHGALLHRHARWLVVAAMGSSIAGCAGGGEPPVATNAAAVAHGAALAEQACGGCHGLGLTGASHWAGAPPFRDMSFDYDAIKQDRRLAQMHMGRVRMPPAEISLEDVADIGAYVRSLRPRARVSGQAP